MYYTFGGKPSTVACLGVERDGGGQARGVHPRHQRVLPAGDRGVLQPQLLQGPPGQDRRVPADGGIICTPFCFHFQTQGTTTYRTYVLL